MNSVTYCRHLHCCLDPHCTRSQHLLYRYNNFFDIYDLFLVHLTVVLRIGLIIKIRKQLSSMSGLAKPAAKGARLQSIMDGNPSQSRPLISLAYSYNRPFIDGAGVEVLV